MNYYCCKKCSTTIKKDSTPNGSGCPSGGLHSWTKLGSVGSKNYQCKKCATSVETDSTPNGSGCPEGGLHSWTKL